MTLLRESIDRVRPRPFAFGGMTSGMLPVACAFLAACSGPRRAQDLSIEEEVAALIEKTGALKTFHAVYEVEIEEKGGDSDKTSIEIVYREPGFGRVRSADRADNIIDGDSVYWRADVADGAGKWHRAAWPAIPPSMEVLGELFPRGSETSEAGASFGIEIRTPLALNIQAGRGMRSSPLGWLLAMQDRPHRVSIDGESLVLEAESSRQWVSRETGFLQRVEASMDAATLSLRLHEIHVDEPLDEDLAGVPAEAMDAPSDPEMTRQLQGALGHRLIRQKAFLHVQMQLDSGTRSWNDYTRDDWRTFIVTFHREVIPDLLSEWKAKHEEYAEKMAEWIASQRVEDSPARQAEIENRIAGDRERLEETLEASRSRYLELPAIESEKAEPRAELFDIEREVVMELWNELVREPLIANFDAKLGPALDR